jgi:hypothetical protein
VANWQRRHYALGAMCGRNAIIMNATRAMMSRMAAESPAFSGVIGAKPFRDGFA